METWKMLERIPFYEISNCGKIRSLRNKKILKPSVNQYGYQLVSLWDGKKRHTSYVHRLVGETFAPEDADLKLEINHLDKNRWNNSIENLEWVSPSENRRHQMDTERYMLFKKLADMTKEMTNEQLKSFIEQPILEC
jgi:hypothetical protein